MSDYSLSFSSEKLSIIRNYRSATIEDIAKAIGVETSTVKQWESGEAKPSAQNVVDLAKYLNVRQCELTKRGGMFAASIVLAALENLQRENSNPKDNISHSGYNEEKTEESVTNPRSYTFSFKISQGLWERLQKSMDHAGYPSEDTDLYIQSLIAEDYRRMLKSKIQQNQVDYQGKNIDWQ